MKYIYRKREREREKVNRLVRKYDYYNFFLIIIINNIMNDMKIVYLHVNVAVKASWFLLSTYKDFILKSIFK